MEVFLQGILLLSADLNHLPVEVAFYGSHLTLQDVF